MSGECMRKLILLFTILAVGGCATAYVAPTTGDIALIQFPAPKSDVGFGYANGIYVFIGDIDSKGCAVNKMRIDEDIYDSGGMKVPAGKEIFVGINYLNAIGTRGDKCELGGAATLEKNKLYKVMKQLISSKMILVINKI